MITGKNDTISPDKLYRMPYSGKDIPHAVIEVNNRCNIACQACYKTLTGYTKPLDIIKNEIDFILTKRNLHIITLAGGEPTLHPDLPEIIRYISAKGILVDVLSNGFGLTDRKLADYKKSKINKILLHIDAHQDRPDLDKNKGLNGLTELISTISQKVSAHGIRCGLAATLYKRDLADFRENLSAFFNSKIHQTLLAICCTDPSPLAEKIHPSSPLLFPSGSSSLLHEVVSNNEVIEYLQHHFKLLPHAYIPSTKNRSGTRWIFYASFVIHLKNGKTKLLHTGKDFKHIVKAGMKRYYKKRGKYPFDMKWGKNQIFYNCILYALSSLNPLMIFKALFFLAGLLKPGSALNYKTMIFQQGPNVADNGEIEYCLNCPDITVRGNTLVPVCVTDMLEQKVIS